MEFVSIKDRPSVCRFEDLDIGEYFVWFIDKNNQPIWASNSEKILYLKVSDTCYFEVKNKVLCTLCDYIDCDVLASLDMHDGSYSHNAIDEVKRVRFKADIIEWEVVEE
jgi:hypothetical protein